MLNSIFSNLFSLTRKYKIGAIVGFSYSLISLIIFSIIANSGDLSNLFNTLPIFVQVIIILPVYALTVIWAPLVMFDVYIHNTIFAYAESTSLIYQFDPHSFSSYLAPVILVFSFTMLGIFFQKMIGFVKK
ncbi:MAG TPA: hypothetical protein VMW74_07310 [Nitrosopumilaceae archaeon]|nr:hypothetical protein [Nitrosopumilaceae archaeon]